MNKTTTKRKSGGASIARCIDPGMQPFFDALEMCSNSDDGKRVGKRKKKMAKKSNDNGNGVAGGEEQMEIDEEEEEAEEVGVSSSEEKKTKKRVGKKRKKKRLRSRNEYIDAGLEDEDGDDHFADLEGFVVD